MLNTANVIFYKRKKSVKVKDEKNNSFSLLNNLNTIFDIYFNNVQTNNLLDNIELIKIGCFLCF